MSETSILPQLPYVFYAVGLIFLFATLVYFSYEYVLHISTWAKAAILVCLTIGFFLGAELMEAKDI